MIVKLNGETMEFHPHGLPKGIKGTILAIPVNPLNNKLILVVRWSERISQDETDRYEAVFDIKGNQWQQIIERDLIGKQVEFDLLDENMLLIKVTYPDIPYTEKEVETLVTQAWIEGYDTCNSSGGRIKRHPALAAEFWEHNRKKK